MTQSLARFGGGLGLALLLACGGGHPSLNIVPDTNNMYSGYKAGAARNGIVIQPAANTLNKLWQIKFRYPLLFSPSLSGDYLFQPGTDKKIHVVSINDRQEIAEIKIRRPLGCSPELADSFMAVCEDGENSKLLVINYLTGKLIWDAKTRKVCFPPALYNNKIFWVDGNKKVNAALLATGKSLWQFEVEKAFDAGPVVFEGKVIVLTADSLINCLDSETGKILWQGKCPARANSSPACFDGTMYLCLGDGTVAAFDINTGNNLWRHQELPRLFYSPAVDSSGVYFGTGDGRFVRLDRKSGSVIWDYQTDSPIRGSALITATDAIFSNLDHKVFLLNKEDGRLVSSYTIKGMISAAPALLDNQLYIAAQDKYLYCFSLREEK